MFWRRGSRFVEHGWSGEELRDDFKYEPADSAESLICYKGSGGFNRTRQSFSVKKEHFLCNAFVKKFKQIHWVNPFTQCLLLS